METEPQQSSRLRRAGCPGKAAPGEGVFRQRRPRTSSHRSPPASWETPLARPPILYTSVPRFSPEWAVFQSLRTQGGQVTRAASARPVQQPVNLALALLPILLPRLSQIFENLFPSCPGVNIWATEVISKSIQISDFQECLTMHL